MPDKNIQNRFGKRAIQKGYISKDQLLDALAIQIEQELEGVDPDPIGSELYKMEYITLEQIDDVVKNVDESTFNHCPNCGALIHKCPNCGADFS